MEKTAFSIEAVRPWDIPTLTLMAYRNMTGVDADFTRFTQNPLWRAAGYFVLPLYLLTAGRGYKAVVGDKIAGCAYLHPRQESALVFNVQVNRQFRRQGLGKALMNHLEQEGRKRSLSWCALQVDEKNRAAQELYLKLGYRPYHPYLLRQENPDSNAGQLWETVLLRTLSPWEGRRQFTRYASLERRKGDAWAASVIEKDYDEGPPARGRYWSCIYDEEEIGCAWLNDDRSGAKLHLMLEPAYWEHSRLAAGIVQQARRALNLTEEVRLYLGSSMHHKLAASGLGEHGFRECRRSRLFMLKRIRW